MFSVSMTLGDMEVSAGMTIRMTPDSASVDMLYLSAPNGDGTFLILYQRMYFACLAQRHI